MSLSNDAFSNSILVSRGPYARSISELFGALGEICLVLWRQGPGFAAKHSAASGGAGQHTLRETFAKFLGTGGGA